MANKKLSEEKMGRSDYVVLSIFSLVLIMLISGAVWYGFKTWEFHSQCEKQNGRIEFESGGRKASTLTCVLPDGTSTRW